MQFLRLLTIRIHQVGITDLGHFKSSEVIWCCTELNWAALWFACLLAWLVAWLVVVYPFPCVPDVPASLRSLEICSPFVARQQQRTNEKGWKRLKTYYAKFALVLDPLVPLNRRSRSWLVRLGRGLLPSGTADSAPSRFSPACVVQVEDVLEQMQGKKDRLL